MSAQQAPEAERAFLEAIHRSDQAAMTGMARGESGFLASQRLNQGDTALGIAVRLGNLALVRELLGQRVDPNQTDTQGWPPLAWAVIGEQLEIIRVLLSAGANPNLGIPGGETVGSLASNLGSRAVLNALGIAASREDSPAARLAEAVLADDGEGIKSALSEGARVGDRSPDGMPLLVFAAATGRVRSVATLLEHQAPANAVGSENLTPLIAAARAGHAAIVGLLLQSGADPLAATAQGISTLDAARLSNVAGVIGQVERAVASKDAAAGLRMLASAVERGDEGAVQALLEVVVDPNGPTDRPPVLPLNVAAFRGHVGLVRLLLDKGADPNKVDARGVSPLLAATLGRKEEVVDLLLLRRSDPSRGDNDGLTPLAAALHLGMRSLALRYQERTRLVPDEVRAAVLRGDLELVTRHYQTAPDRADRTREIATVLEGFTVLALAARTGNLPMVEALLGLGASADGQEGQEVTPLAAAAMAGKDNVVRALLAAGANSLAENSSGQNARQLALRANHRTTAALLLPAQQARARQLSQYLKSFGYDVAIDANWTDEKERVLDQFRRRFQRYAHPNMLTWFSNADRAAIRVCNSGSREVSVAVARISDNPQEARVVAWFNAGSGACTWVASPTPPTRVHIYVDRGRAPALPPQSGDQTFCVRDARVNETQQVSARPSCPTENNGRAVRFREIPINGTTSGLVTVR